MSPGRIGVGSWRACYAALGMASNSPITWNTSGDTLFQHACAMGLEGIVAKRRDRPYRSGSDLREYSKAFAAQCRDIANAAMKATEMFKEKVH